MTASLSNIEQLSIRYSNDSLLRTTLHGRKEDIQKESEDSVSVIYDRHYHTPNLCGLGQHPME